MKKSTLRNVFASTLVGTFACTAPTAFSADFSVDIQNLTSGIYFTPFVVAAHTDDSKLFTVGEAASPEIQAMAEGGDITGLAGILDSINATQANNPAMGLLAPGASTSADLNTDGTNNVRLTIAAMLLPTNDGFAALNAITIPTEAGIYTYDVPAYDAGTEANTELMNPGMPGGMPGGLGIPAAPGMDTGTGGTGVATADSNSSVHIHRGTLGDTDLTAGASDLDSRIHRWLNPVVRVTVTVR